MTQGLDKALEQPPALTPALEPVVEQEVAEHVIEHTLDRMMMPHVSIFFRLPLAMITTCGRRQRLPKRASCSPKTRLMSLSVTN
jgi:hypothetical protein